MSKILNYISHLTPDQQKQLLNFVLSPYLNPGKDEVRTNLASLLEILMKFHNLKNLDNWEKKAYSQWKKGEVFNQNTFRKACSALVKLYYEFLGFEHYRDQSRLVYLHQLRGLNQMGAHKYFEKFYEDVTQSLEKEPQSIDSSDFWVKSEMYHTYFSYSLLREKRKRFEDLDLAIANLDQYYLLQKVKYVLARLSQHQILGAEKSMDEITHLINLYDQLATTDPMSPIIDAYFLLLKVYSVPENHALYISLKKKLKDDLPNIDFQELRNLINGVINFCVFQIRRGESSYRSEFWEVYKLMIDREVIWINGKILAWDVINLTVYHLEEGDYEWVESFIELCEDRLVSSQMQQVKLFCRGLMAYYQKEYKQARKDFEILLGKFDDVFYGLNIRVAKARLLYEIDDSELDFLLNSAPAYIKSQAISSNQKKNRLVFFRLLKRLYNIRPYDKKRLRKLLDDIKGESQISSKKWLMEQVKEKLEF